MTMFKRIGFFILTNFLVITTLMVVLNVAQAWFGVEIQGYAYYAVLAGVFGMGGAFISLAMSKWMAKKMMGVQIIDQRVGDHRLRNVVEKTHQYAKAAGLRKMPEVGVYDSPEVNAFATGPSKNNSLVAVSTGLLHRMTDDEVDGVIGHEVAHIANGDMVTMTLVQGIINTVAIFLSFVIARAIASAIDKDNRGGGFMEFGIRIAVQYLLSFLGMFVVAWFSRYREYRADAGGARLAGREKMVAGLEKLKGTLDLVDNQQEAMASLKISGGRKKRNLMFYLSTHPPLDERIEALQRARIV